MVLIPDLHFPYHDSAALELCIRFCEDYRPRVIVQLGDLYDQFSFSKYARDLSAVELNPADEHRLARIEAETMWARLKKTGAECYQIIDGNHDLRVIKRMAEKLPEHAFIGKSWLDEQLDFPGVAKLSSEAVIDGVMIMHGMRKPGEHARYNQMNTVTGHTHKARIEYFANINGSYWEMNCGWLGDKKAPVFSYRSQTKIDDTNIGFGVIQDGQPRFVSI